MEQNETVYERAYRFLVEKTLERYGVRAIGLKIVTVDDGGEKKAEDETA